MIDPDRSVQDRLARLTACVRAATHNVQQHRDAKPPWCRVCGLTDAGEVPTSYLDRHAGAAAPSARTEASLERSFNDAVQKAGGEPVKLSPANRAGIPDRFVIWPGGVVDLVELKRDGEEPSVLQTEVHRQLNRMGHDVYLVVGEQAIKLYVAYRLRMTIPTTSESLPGRVARFDSVFDS